MLSRLVPQPDAGTARPAEVRDPVLTALAAGGSGTAMVLEVNALRNSPIGELLLRCLAEREGRGNALAALQQMGIDPLRDIDRVGITEHGIVVSGDFRRANWEGLLGSAAGARYGEGGQVTTVAPRADGGATLVATRWGDSLLHLGDSEEDARRVLDAIEGRGPAPRPLLTPEQSYGELYGVVTGPDLAQLMGGSEGWSAALADAASRMELHLDARRDVALVADVAGDDPTKLADLGKTLGGALAVARAQARASGDTETAELLGYARVSPTHGRRDLARGGASTGGGGTAARLLPGRRRRRTVTVQCSGLPIRPRPAAHQRSALVVAGEVAEDDLVQALLGDRDPRRRASACRPR